MSASLHKNEVTAILLAAGIGRRLRPYTEDRPKCRVEVGGRSLLHRHLDLLSDLEAISRIVIVVGYLKEQIVDSVARWREETGSDFPVEFMVNERYTLGSILSLYEARQALNNGHTITMDADVLYDREVMTRLLDSEHGNCFLIDDGAEESGEEMMVCIKDGHARHIARSRDPSTHTGWDHKGEGVGFFRLAKSCAPDLVADMETLIAEGQEGAEYEVALARFMKDHVCGYETISDLPWTEIDFEEDVEHAEKVVLPAIDARARS